MLKDDPPPGTKVTLLRDVGLAKSRSIATLVQPLRAYYIERPEDEFQIEHRGQLLTVRREDIE